MASCHLLISHLLKPRSLFVAASSSSSSSSTLSVNNPLKISLHLQLHKSLPALFHSPSPRPHCFCSSSSSSSSLLIQEDHTNLKLDSHEKEEEEELTSENPISPLSHSPVTQQEQQDKGNVNVKKVPNLTIKEKKELASYAHGLGKKLKIQLVGKSGVTDSLAAAFVENLESNELLKVKIHNSCPGELPDVVQQLEVTTGSVAVGQIGRSVILYRPSISKLKAEEKKRQNKRLMAARSFRPKHTEFQVKPAEFRYKPDESKMEKREAASNFSARGKRGTSRNGLS